jgi:DNA-binding response OmpR family regulator
MSNEITENRAKVLLVDDNPRVRSFVMPALEDAGFSCIEAEDGWSALDKIEKEHPDLVILDIILGDDEMSGLDVCKSIRKKGNRIPVIFLTIKDRREDPRYLERAFQLGADDYVTKREELRLLEQKMGLAPTEFIGQKSDIEELVARIKTRLNAIGHIQQFDNYLYFDPGKQEVKTRQEGIWHDIHLTTAEFEILAELIKADGRPVGKNQLMDVAGVDGEGSLQNHIWRLRNKLEPAPEVPVYILTYHSIGYRFSKQT